MKISRKDKTVAAIIAATFPDYTGRKISAEARHADRAFSFRANFWSEGTRSFYAAYDLASGRAIELPSLNPMQRTDVAAEVPANILIVEHAFFCGTDCGLRLHVHPSNFARLLSAGDAR